MNLTVDLIPSDSKCDTHQTFQTGCPSTITIHWVGPYPGQTPKVVRDWWVTSGGEASAHYIVKDDEVLQCWPINKVAWHAGCKAGNLTSIGIEVIPEDKTGKFSDKSIATLRELLNNVLPRLPVVRHYDWTGKECPKYYCNLERWKDLLLKVNKG